MGSGVVVLALTQVQSRCARARKHDASASARNAGGPAKKQQLHSDPTWISNPTAILSRSRSQVPDAGGSHVDIRRQLAEAMQK
eukprot:3980748-Pyramimonas_sp.AAC.1